MRVKEASSVRTAGLIESSPSDVQKAGDVMEDEDHALS